MFNDCIVVAFLSILFYFMFVMVMQSGQRSGLSDQFFCFWFYFLALDVKLILLIIDNFLVKAQKCVQPGGVDDHL